MSEQKHVEPVIISSSMSHEQADVMGVMAFAMAMHSRMTACREMGKSGWHMPGTIDPVKGSDNEIAVFKSSCLLAVQEGRFVDAANYCMMMYNRERMEKE